MMQGNAGKAVRELKKYLELSPDAPEKEKVAQQIAQLEEAIKAKDKSYLMGISLIQFSDGIYISRVNPNYPVDATAGRLNSRTSRGGGSTGVKSGDKILTINNNDVRGYSIQALMKLIEEDTITGPESSKYRRIEVERGGQTISLLMYRGHKKTSSVLRDLGEDDLSAIIAETKTPLIVAFLSDWCDDCDKYMNDLSFHGNRNKGTLTIVMVNVDENMYTAKDFNVSKAPVINMYKNGVLVEKIAGFDKDLLEKKVKSLLK
jgi:hypothetical protein